MLANYGIVEYVFLLNLTATAILVTGREGP
jgi:hypothetical protein